MHKWIQPQSLVQQNSQCLLGSFAHISVPLGIAYASGEHSNIPVAAEICEQLSSFAKANLFFALMRCQFSFTSAFLHYCIHLGGIVGGQRKKDGFSEGCVSFQIGFQMPRCHVRRNGIHSSIHVGQYGCHHSGCTWKCCTLALTELFKALEKQCNSHVCFVPWSKHEH